MSAPPPTRRNHGPPPAGAPEAVASLAPWPTEPERAADAAVCRAPPPQRDDGAVPAAAPPTQRGAPQAVASLAPWLTEPERAAPAAVCRTWHAALPPARGLAEAEARRWRRRGRVEPLPLQLWALATGLRPGYLHDADGSDCAALDGLLARLAARHPAFARLRTRELGPCALVLGPAAPGAAPAPLVVDVGRGGPRVLEGGVPSGALPAEAAALIGYPVALLNGAGGGGPANVDRLCVVRATLARRALVQFSCPAELRAEADAHIERFKERLRKAAAAVAVAHELAFAEEKVEGCGGVVL